MDVENFHKRLKELYQPQQDQFTIIDVPEIAYLAIDGQGDPDNDMFSHAIKWLYSVTHLIKPLIKEKMGKNFVEPPLECLFWADSEQNFAFTDKSLWKWRVMIVMIPDWVSQEALSIAIEKAEKKLGPAPTTLRVHKQHEKKSVQIMHVGNYKGIQLVCDKLYREFLPQNNLTPNGYYHEIYLNDPNRVSPDKRKTVIRQPVC